MKQEALVEIFHEGSNFVVMKAPGRKYPGVLIQGDSLGGIVSELAQAIDLFESDREESLGCLKLAFEGLQSRLEQYNEACKANNIE